MLLIQRLKRYGFSLEEVRDILRCTEQGALLSKMLQQKEKLVREKKDMELAIGELTAHMQNYERTGDLMDYQKGYRIEVKEVPARNVIACRQKMSVDEFGKYYSALYERVPKEHVTPNGVVGAVYYDKEFDRECSDIELIVGIREKEKADKVIEAGLCAVTVHKGPYSSLPEAYAALVEWSAENGYTWNGEPYEIYTKKSVSGRLGDRGIFSGEEIENRGRRPNKSGRLLLFKITDTAVILLPKIRKNLHRIRHPAYIYHLILNL